MSSSQEGIQRVLERRSSVLASLKASPTRKPDLVDELNMSRLTIDRAISELTEAGLVRKSGSAYAVTTAERLAL